MKRAIVTAVMLMSGATWAFAQSYPSQTGQSTGSAQTITIQGCVGRADGTFTLTDNSGAQYELTGDRATLSDHIGHEVEITGSKSKAATPMSTTEATTNQNQARIDVSSLKHISATCTSKSEAQRPPMSEQPSVPPR